jgi:hypothetical protein
MKKNFLFALTFVIGTGMSHAQSWEWAQRGGGQLLDIGNSVDVDLSGNVYTTGSFSGVATFGTIVLRNAAIGNTLDIFIAKYDNSGNILWAKGFGGTGSDYPGDIKTDAEGNIYVCGTFSGTATFGNQVMVSNGGMDAFLAKLDPSGNLIWIRKAGGAQDDEAFVLDITRHGNIYMTGYFGGNAAFFANQTLTGHGNNDVFLAKYSSSGTPLWARVAGSSGTDKGYTVCSGKNEEVFMACYFTGAAEFDSAHTLVSRGAEDVAVARYSGSGELKWVKHFGGPTADYPFEMGRDSKGNVYLTGYFTGSSAFDHINLTSKGGQDIFLVKLSGGSGAVEWAKRAGGSQTDAGNSLVIDGNDNVYISGYIFGIDCDFDNTTLIAEGYYDPFIARYNGSGNVVFALRMGGSTYDTGLDLACDAQNNVYSSGLFTTEAVFGTHVLVSSGAFEYYVAKLNPGGAPAIGLKKGTGTPGAPVFSVYPNPATDKLYISFAPGTESHRIELRDMLGRSVRVISSPPEEQKVELNLDQMEKGIYLLEIRTGSETETRKIIIR